MKMNNNLLLPALQQRCVQLSTEFEQIPIERKRKLATLSEYLSTKYQAGKTPRLVVICTHNSRRSHLGQLWLPVAALYYGLPNLESYSGGTEATAFYPRAVAAAQRAGFIITPDTQIAENPIYRVQWQPDQPPYLAFSKRYDDPANPKHNFAAIMVCNSADEGCPLVAGCDFRIALPFDDPKTFDNQPEADKKYTERLHDIGRQLLYVMHKVVY